MEEEKIQCPKCGSTQLSANKRGWSIATGMIGSGSIRITCLRCGHTFRPGRDRLSLEKKNQKLSEDYNKLTAAQKNAGCFVVGAIILIIVIVMWKGCSQTRIY